MRLSVGDFPTLTRFARRTPYDPRVALLSSSATRWDHVLGARHAWRSARDCAVGGTPLGAEAAPQAAARVGDGWVFPSPTDPEKPIRRDLLRDWWQKLEAGAKLDRIRGRGWHRLRRKCATDMKHDTPIADLCAVGRVERPQHCSPVLHEAGRGHDARRIGKAGATSGIDRLTIHERTQ